MDKIKKDRAKILMLESGRGEDIEQVSQRRRQHGFSETTTDDFIKSGLNIHTIRQLKSLLGKQAFSVESWKTANVKNKKSSIIEGVKSIIFPTIYLSGIDFSFSLLQSLKKEINKNKIIIHSHLYHSPLLWIILLLFGREVPIISVHHGAQNPQIKMRKIRTYHDLLVNILLNIEIFIESLFLRYIDVFKVQTIEEKNYIFSQTASKEITVVQSLAVDTEKFIPLDKNECRQRLGFPIDCKIMLYVGRAYKPKGVHISLNAFLKLREQYNLRFIIAGCYKSDELYKLSIQSGVDVFNWVSHEELPLFYNAADVYILPMFDRNNGSKLGTIGGPGAALIESLSCGTPAVSTGLKHFPENSFSECGLIPMNPADVPNQIKTILDNPEKFPNSRNIVKNYYSWTSVVKELISDYDKLLLKYT